MRPSLLTAKQVSVFPAEFLHGDLTLTCFLAHGTGSGKTFTMGSSADQILAEETAGIIPRFIKNLFHMIAQKEEEDPNNAFKVYVQFLEIYGEDIRDLLDQTRTSKVVIRETRNGEVFLTGAREELVSSFEQMMKALEDGTRNRTTSSTKMNLTSSRSHGKYIDCHKSGDFSILLVLCVK